jgi:hypothetical protein
MTKEQIIAEKAGVMVAFHILHHQRLDALKRNLIEPGTVEVPDQSYMILNYLVKCMPEDVPMPRSHAEQEEYTKFKTGR